MKKFSFIISLAAMLIAAATVNAQEKPATYSAGVKNADQASIIDKLKADAEARTQQLADLV